MRPLRFLLSITTCVIAFFLLLYNGPWRTSVPANAERRSSIRSYLHWRTPSSLFPPSAVITLTDDNSTYFLARPAAFGPLLPAKSLTGQLWIGSGFSDDRLSRSNVAEGELGCSDVPGWGDGSYTGGGKSLSEAKSLWASPRSGTSRNAKRSDSSTTDDDDEEGAKSKAREPSQDDGTDDYLHHPLPASDGLKSNGVSKAAHADIQSLQESAEIAGKIVLLSRGGCGFLEKVKWVQRRGGVALIVGDDVRSAPLVTMYARGDTSNITIPSLFVSHTTAHLLSGLVPFGSMVSGLTPPEAERLGLAFGEGANSGKSDSQKGAMADKPVFTTSTAATKPTPTAQYRDQNKLDLLFSGTDAAIEAEVGWFRSFFSKKDGTLQAADSRRPPTSGNVGWVLQEEFDVDPADPDAHRKEATSSTSVSSKPSKPPTAEPDDGFVIGVQDWRDPDLAAYRKQQLKALTATTSGKTQSAMAAAFTAILKGGSILPGSGEYAKAVHEAVDLLEGGTSGQQGAASSAAAGGRRRLSAGWFSQLFGSTKGKHSDSKLTASEERFFATSQPFKHFGSAASDVDVREGLWVTLTPTSMSSSPFFDTLLVLVVSPLVTLTIVYALLLLRSRIRRRRWRAPKSVVERLPVRTYQTMPSSTAPASSAASSTSSPITVTTPLLPFISRPINAGPRPRSRTASDVPIQPSSSLRSDSTAVPSPDQIEEKRAAGLSEWRRRYGGKQRECVVCLEEYIDGVSRVMSLPCGHEFHAECITPWLTTRRRTCPICKGDVVRSLARSSGNTSASPVDGTFSSEEDSDDVQEQAAVTRNDDPAAARPVSREDEAFEDLERGIEPDRSR